MKTEKEIREEMEDVRRTMENYRNEYKNGKTTQDVFDNILRDCYATLSVLKWVLGENDRYD